MTAKTRTPARQAGSKRPTIRWRAKNKQMVVWQDGKRRVVRLGDLLDGRVYLGGQVWKK